MIEFRIIIITSNNTSTLLSRNTLRQIPLFSDEAVIFLSSIVVFTPNGQFLSCAATAFSEPYYVFGVSWKRIVICFCNGFETWKLISR